jgi:FAD/FMN-containing dehydrogenase
MVDRRPALIARCPDEGDVVLALEAAREQGLAVAVRGGGHNVAGNGVCDGGVVIDLSAQKAIEVDPEKRIARAGPGVLLGELDRATQVHGFATPTGNVSMTGVAGLTLGGGLGWIARKHGPACDNLLAAEVVTADGERVRASMEENPDLLWGLRGGGGNFGVVTSFEYRLHRVGPEVLAGGVLHAFTDAPELFGFLRKFVAESPDELSVTASTFRASAAIPVAPEVHGELVTVLAVCYVGELAAGEAALRFGVLAGRCWTASRRCPTRRFRAGQTRRIRAVSTTTGSRTISQSSPTMQSPRSSSTRRACALRCPRSISSISAARSPAATAQRRRSGTAMDYLTSRF